MNSDERLLQYGHEHECMHCVDGITHSRCRCHCGSFRLFAFRGDWHPKGLVQIWDFPVRFVRTKNPRKR